MSVESLTAVLNHSRARGTAKLVLIGIANHDGDGGAWPAVATLARYANVDERTVQRALASLCRAGEITVQRQSGGVVDCPEFERTNLYRIQVSCPPWCDRSKQHRDTRKGEERLWKNRVTPLSPGDATVTGGVTPLSPGGVTPLSPKPSIEPCANYVPALTTDRARDSAAAARAALRARGGQIT